MKKFYANFKSVVAAVVMASMTLAASCGYDDGAITERVQNVENELAALTERVAAIEKRLSEEVEALTALINGKVVVTEITTDDDGNTVINLSNGEKVTVFAGCDCEPLQYRVVDGVLEVSADGENWVAVNADPECVVTNVVVNEDNTVTITLANGEEFTVVKAEVIEFDSTRSQIYVLPGETKVIPFTINDAVADVNVMDKPLGWSAAVELAEVEEDEDNVDPGMGVLAAGGTEFVLKITGPSKDFVNAGFAEKEGYISVHFNSENGGCKVGNILVNLAEIKLDVDNAGNITLENTVAYEQTNYFGDKFVDFADFHIGVVPAEVYAQYGDKSFTDNFDDWTYEYTVNVASTKRSTGLGNVIDLQQYQEGVTEKEVYNFTVETLANAFWPTYTFEYGKEYIIFVSLEGEMVNYFEHPVLKGAVMDNYKRTLIEAEYVADSATWNDASFNISLAGYQYYVIGWYADDELNDYIANGVADSVETLVPMLIQNYGVMSAGAVVTGDFLDQTVTLSSLAASSVSGWAPGLDPDTKYHFFIYPFNAASEMEIYQHTVVNENVYLFDTFETSALTEGTFDAGITYEVVTMTEDSLNVSAYFGEEVVAFYFSFYSSPAEVPADRALEIIEYEMIYTFDEYTTFCEAYQYKPTYPAYLCIVAINAAGEYVYAEQEFAPVPLPEVAITSFEYLGRYWELDDNDETSGGDYVYLVKTEDGNEYKLGVYYDYCNADGTIKEGTYDYCYNQFDVMYSSWAGFIIESETQYYGSKLVVAADKITLTIAEVADYVYIPGQGGDDSGETPAGNVFTTAGAYGNDLGTATVGNWNDMYVVLTDAAGNKLALNFYNSIDDDTQPYLSGVYNVDDNGYNIIYVAPYSKYYEGGNTYGLTGGSVTVTEADGKYKFDINVEHEGGNLVASFEGLVEGLILPSAYVEPEAPEPGEVIELTISGHITLYSGAGEHEIGFIYDEANGTYSRFDFLANPIVAGTYTLHDNMNSAYCSSHGGGLYDCTIVVTDNGDGTLTFDANFVAADKNAYHFTYTAQIYS